MNILVGEDYLITSDNYNVIINQRYEKKEDGEGTGEFSYRSIAFTGQFESAVNYLLDREIRVADAENLSELHRIVMETKEDISKAIDQKNNQTIKELQERIREQNSIINSVKSLYVRCDNDGRPVETYELFDVLNPEKGEKK
jgi:hypothetical protein